jgi:hypothetical protein
MTGTGFRAGRWACQFEVRKFNMVKRLRAFLGRGLSVCGRLTTLSRAHQPDVRSNRLNECGPDGRSNRLNECGPVVMRNRLNECGPDGRRNRRNAVLLEKDMW